MREGVKGNKSGLLISRVVEPFQLQVPALFFLVGGPWDFQGIVHSPDGNRNHLAQVSPEGDPASDECAQANPGAQDTISLG